nr:MAG TPA: hypothetical protein [Caudoviricetes sp.]
MFPIASIAHLNILHIHFLLFHSIDFVILIV